MKRIIGKYFEKFIKVEGEIMWSGRIVDKFNVRVNGRSVF